MIFNNGMTIWIFAILVMAVVATIGWREGGSRAAIMFGGLLIAYLLAPVFGMLFKLILPYLGVSNPMFVWALAPVCGFILVMILVKVAAYKVHAKVENYYKYKAGDLRLALWGRLNTRLGICVGLLNGAVYFLLFTFLIYNFSYLTAQAASETKTPSIVTRLVNQMGRDLQSSGLSRSSAALGSMPPVYYQISDVVGTLMQNPQAGTRVAQYPGFTSLWQRDDMQVLVTDGSLTGCLSSDSTLGDIVNEQNTAEFLKNKELRNYLLGVVETNLVDFTAYLQTGNSAVYSDKILGSWHFNTDVSIAWLAQTDTKIQPNELRAVKALWSQIYSNTTILATGDHQIFVRSLPHFKQGQPPDKLDWKGDWSQDGASYTLHVTYNSEDKFMEATPSPEGLRLTVKDGKALMIFDRVY
jgi:hypothetical protein